jgi:hypothetical protein
VIIKVPKQSFGTSFSTFRDRVKVKSFDLLDVGLNRYFENRKR